MIFLDGYRPRTEQEAGDVARMAAASWDRDTPLHLTVSALIVHPPTGRVLLRWHARQQAWLQVGGHADPGEDDPVAIALREGAEETGLTDLRLWPGAGIVHAVICPVPAGDREPAHEHGDVRYLLITDEPDAARPEKPGADLRWLTLAAARELTGEDNLRETLERVADYVEARTR